MDRRLDGPGVCLDAVEKRKNLVLSGIEYGSFSPQPIAIMTELSPLPTN
jgi:hypothetical protein